MTRFRVRKLRDRLREEAAILDAASMRLRDLSLEIPPPGLEELRALEAGEIPLTREAVWISLLGEHAYLVAESAEALSAGASETRAALKSDWLHRPRPDAKLIAHLRGSLRGRTLPESFLPAPRIPPSFLLHLYGQSYVSLHGAALVTDLPVERVAVGWVRGDGAPEVGLSWRTWLRSRELPCSDLGNMGAWQT